MRVGFLGVGHMGRPMVDRLRAHDWDPTVYVRRPEVAQELRDAGVRVADSATELAASADLLILCFFSDAQVREVMFDGGVLDAARSGCTIATHVTGSPDLVLQMADRAPSGVRVLDMPISGGPGDIEAGRLTILAGGDATDVERVRPVFESYADPIIHVGRLGDAMRTKLINNLVFTANLDVALQAADLARSMGVEPADLARVLAHCSGDSFAMRQFTGGADPAVLAEGARPYLAKDVAVVRDVTAAMNIDLGRLGELAAWVDDERSVPSP
jgi:3-hydroxyisobutyrate dehydrogenase-like beta-hydroxyacid dehydrogenase